MKKFAGAFFSILLCVAILFGTQGITIGKMICLKSGRTIYSLKAPVDCCKKDAAGKDVIKPKCCDLKSSTLKLSGFHGIDLKTSIPLFATMIEYSVLNEPVIPEYLTVELCTNGPPLSGRAVLILHSTFLI
jgi:hypothetical protein